MNIKVCFRREDERVGYNSWVKEESIVEKRGRDV